MRSDRHLLAEGYKAISTDTENRQSHRGGEGESPDAKGGKGGANPPLTEVRIDVVSGEDGHRAVVFFDGKQVTQTQPFPDRDAALLWAQHLETIGLKVPGSVRRA